MSLISSLARCKREIPVARYCSSARISLHQTSWRTTASASRTAAAAAATSKRFSSPPIVGHRNFTTTQWLRDSAETSSVSSPDAPPSADDRALSRNLARKLPLSCPGCGAPSQTVAPTEAGYYSIGRSGVKSYVKEDTQAQDDIFDHAISTVEAPVLDQLGLTTSNTEAEGDSTSAAKSTPICDRCHNLIHHSTGVAIFHPSIESIESIIAESPHKHNHIYHVLDAADFPMSLIPNLQHDLNLPRLRTQNRRSKNQKFARGRIAEVSFIITRSDLLAPKKEQVDTLMPYLRETLRDALGKAGHNVRLGNLRCVSSQRGWWTKEVKEDIWARGGAGWMVGKVNVGKSKLFEVVFPKGRGVGSDLNLDRLRREAGRTGKASFSPLTGAQTIPQPRANQGDPLTDLPGGLDADVDADVDAASDANTSEDATSTQSELVGQPTEGENEDSNDQYFDEDEGASLLPPAQQETAYPVMPVISSLPGTTASPIRVPFGNGRGELIDLPGVARTTIDNYVKDEHKRSLVMRSKVMPEQRTIKPRQSLLIGGGLIRITPTTPDLVFLSYAFVPLPDHVTSTDKAAAIQSEERETGIQNIVAEGTAAKMASAGTFKLEWDVTKKRAGPLTSASAVKLKPEQLPFKVYSADILIEGVGWIELVAQVRKQRRRPVTTYEPHSSGSSSSDTNSSIYRPISASSDPAESSPPAPTIDTDTFTPIGPSSHEGAAAELIPEVEVFTPEGKFVAVRRPMCASLLGSSKTNPKQAKARPRRSMKSQKLSDRGRTVQRGAFAAGGE